MVDDDPLARLVLERFIAQDEELELAGSCATAVEAAKVLRRERVDLLFLDVEMPEMSGFELLQTVEQRFEVILVTGKKEFALDAFEAGVLDYLVKPVSYARFLKAVGRARKRAGEGPQPGDEWIFVRIDRGLVRIDLDEIVRVEAARDYVVYHTSKGPRRVRDTLEAIAQRLPSRHFIRIHRSHIVRLDQVVDFQHNSVVVGREVISVGASYRPGLLERLRVE